MSSIVAMFLFLSPSLFTAHPAINRSHSAEAFLSACVGLWQQLPLDGGERMACQGQNCALISVHHWTAGLTPAPFTPEASWHYVSVWVLCFLSCFPFPFSSIVKAGHLRLPIQHIRTLSCPSLTQMGQSYNRQREKRGRWGGEYWALASHWALCACYSLRSHRQERANERRWARELENVFTIAVAGNENPDDTNTNRRDCWIMIATENAVAKVQPYLKG